MACSFTAFLCVFRNKLNLKGYLTRKMPIPPGEAAKDVFNMMYPAFQYNLLLMEYYDPLLMTAAKVYLYKIFIYLSWFN